MESAYDTISSKLKLSQEQSIGDEKEGARPRTANEPLTIDDDDEEEDLYEDKKSGIFALPLLPGPRQIGSSSMCSISTNILR